MYFPRESAASFWGSRYARTAAAIQRDPEHAQRLSNSNKRVRYLTKTRKKLWAYEAAYMVSDLLTLVHSKIKGFLDNHTFTRKSSLSHSFQHRQLCPQRKNSLLQSIIISNWASKGQQKSSILFLV